MTKQELANFCIEKIEDKKFQLEAEPLEYTFYKNLLDEYNFLGYNNCSINLQNNSEFFFKNLFI